MTHLEINHSKVPIRLFKSDVLEFFTRISPCCRVSHLAASSDIFYINGSC